MPHHGGDNLFVNFAGDCQLAVIIHVHTAVFAYPFIYCGIAGTGVESRHLTVRADPGYAGYAGNIDNGQRFADVGTEGIVINRI